MSVQVSIPGLSALTAKFKIAPAKLRERIVRAVGVAGGKVRDQARENVAETFQTPSRMMQALEAYVEVSATGAKARVVAEGLPYLAIHEFGGVVHAPELFAKRPPFALKLEDHDKGGFFALVSHVSAHEIPIPERSYLRRALDQKHDEIIAIFEALL